jgi:hypothetical protein
VCADQRLDRPIDEIGEVRSSAHDALHRLGRERNRRRVPRLNTRQRWISIWSRTRVRFGSASAAHMSPKTAHAPRTTVGRSKRPLITPTSKNAPRHTRCVATMSPRRGPRAIIKSLPLNATP